MARRALYDAAHLLPVAVIAGGVAGSPYYGSRIENFLFPVAKVVVRDQTRTGKYACFTADYERFRRARIDAVDAYAVMVQNGVLVRVDMSPLFVKDDGTLRTFSQSVLRDTAQFKTTPHICFNLAYTDIPPDTEFSLHLTYTYSLPHDLWRIAYNTPVIDFPPCAGGAAACSFAKPHLSAP